MEFCVLFSLVKFLKNEHHTTLMDNVLNYIEYCCNAYLFYRVKREDLQEKQIFVTNEKYYIADYDIQEAVLGNNMQDINLILANIVYTELLCHRYKVTVGKAGIKEIDFI